MRIINVVGARPNFMKIAPLLQEMKKHSQLEPILLHTGQHYDGDMARVFFEQLKLPRPDIDLGVAPGPHAAQTAEIMQKFEQILNLPPKPSLVLVVGDINSTLACALTATKMHIPVAHVEAGLRSYKWQMPEEVNRVVTDRISDLLFTTEEEAIDNLTKEGIDKNKIYFVGNVMIDTLLAHKKEADKSNILNELNTKKGEYVLVTLHRPELVNNETSLKFVLKILAKVQKDIKVIWPLHPRTKKNLEEFNLMPFVEKRANIILTPPQNYLSFIKLMSDAKYVLTDSGGVQEETTVLGVNCLTLRGETERPATVKFGTNVIVDSDETKIFNEIDKIMSGQGKDKKANIPPLWDGQAAKRIVDIIIKELI